MGIDALQERIANAGWWCPWREIEKANDRIRIVRGLIKSCKANKMESEADLKEYERLKAQLVLEIEAANKELEEKKNLGQLFSRLLTAGTQFAEAITGYSGKRH